MALRLNFPFPRAATRQLSYDEEQALKERYEEAGRRELEGKRDTAAYPLAYRLSPKAATKGDPDA